MNVVMRGIMAAALGVYASMHLTQAANGPDGPAWLTLAFAGTGVAAIVLAVALVGVPERLQKWVDGGVAFIAGGSLIALVMSYTVGFFGVSEAELRIETALVLIAEVIALGALAVTLRFADDEDLKEVRRDMRERAGAAREQALTGA